MTRFYATSAVVLILALLGTLSYFVLVGRGNDPFAACRTSQIAGGSAAIGGPFTLIDGSGRTVTDADVITKPSLIYFGYTFCPDVCPVDNARNADAADILRKQGLDVQTIFISVDPKRDTPAVVRDFAQNISPEMIGLTGTPDQIARAAKAYRVYYKIEKPDDDYYLVDHSTFTYLVLPKTGFVDFFRRDTSPENMAKRAACYIDAS